MRELSEAEESILEAIDSQLKKIDNKLAPFQELIEQKNRLVRTKAALLNEKPGGGNRANASLSHEMVQAAFEKSEERYMTVAELSESTGVTASTVRSHLHRGKGTTYKQKGDRWRLIGQTNEGE